MTLQLNFFQDLQKFCPKYLINQTSIKWCFIYKRDRRISSITLDKQHGCIFQIKQQEWILLKCCITPKIFSKFHKSCLGFYKPGFWGTTVVLIQKSLLLVYWLFEKVENVKNNQMILYIRLIFSYICVVTKDFNTIFRWIQI